MSGRDNVEEMSEPIIKSPLDTHGYKMVKMKNNGVQGLLVSTCIHPRDAEIDKMSKRRNNNCIFTKIAEFNETHAGIETNGAENKESQDPAKDYKFAKASEKQKKESKSKWDAANKPPRKRKVKCRKGEHELDDEMQSFCNTKCIGVLYVKAGFFQDPPEVPGMAHFCEHVISLGSKNYPETEAFTKFVETEDGEFNARTEQECTIYYFYLNHEKISEALDIFVDMFTNPLFKNGDLAKEIDNVNSEYEMKKLIDELRWQSIHKSCFTEGHPGSNFGMGSKDSLENENLMAHVKKWIKEYYFGENMIFALQGPLPLPELENLFAEYASKLPGRNDVSIISRPLPLNPRAKIPLPVDMLKWNRLYHMDIAGPSTFMSITWPLDAKYGKNYETKPVYYFSYIFSHKGQGSLDWYLKQKGWITSLAVNSPDSNFFYTEHYTLFSLYMELTSEGLQKRMNILQAIFSYIKLLRREKASEEIFNEIRQLQADIFHYRSDMNLSDPTFGRKFDGRNVNETLWILLHVMSKTPSVPEDLLMSAFLVRKYDPAILREFINLLQVERAMVVFGAKSFADEATKQEKWYKVKYFTKPISPEFALELNNSPIIQELEFPKSNPFITVSFCFPDQNTEDDKIKKQDGVLAYKSAMGELTYSNSKCQKGLLPTAEYILDFMSPALEDDSDLVNTPASDVFILLLKFILDVELGPALSSLISYELESYVGIGFIRAILCGPATKLPQLASIILSVIENFGEHAKKYPKTIEDFKRIQTNFYKSLMNDVEECSVRLLDYVLGQRAHFLSDFVRMLEESLDLDDFLTFVDDFKRKLYVVGDMNGCVTRRQASFVARIIDNMRAKPYKKRLENEVVERALELPLGERCLLVSVKNKENRNVYVRNYYQIGILDTPEKRKIINVIEPFLGEAAFEELRAIQSLGYIAEASVHFLGEVYGLMVCVQGAADNHSCGYINERIDDFLDATFKNCLSTKSQFKKHLVPWLEEGESLSYQTTKNFYMNHLHSSGSLVRKLSIQLQGYPKTKSNPLMPSLVEAKMSRYRSGIPLVRCPTGHNCGLSKYSHYLDLYTKGIDEENGYFITAVQRFKESLPCFGIYLEEDSDMADD